MRPDNYNAASGLTASRDVPIYVDLDGTLVKSDLLHEALFRLLSEKPLKLIRAASWIFLGKAGFKWNVAEQTQIDYSLLPYQGKVLEYLWEERSKGRKIILATAATEKHAVGIAEHLQVFDDVLASDRQLNLKGTKKRDRIIHQCGERGYEYVANGRDDLPVWEKAAFATLVDPERGVGEALKELSIPHHLLVSRGDHVLRAVLRAMRPHQWLKNLLLFVPLIMSQQLADLSLTVLVVEAFIAFGLCASSVYLINDLLDLEADRQHETKKRRPFASGALGFQHGVMLISFLLFLTVLLSLRLPPAFGLCLLGYFVATLLYSIWLKRKSLVDVLMLAFLYTARIIAGASVISIWPSAWLMAFSMFLFFSLAFVKRYAELHRLKEIGGNDKSSGRGYEIGDLESVSQFGIASALVATLVLALYINSQSALNLYSHPALLWLICPIALYVLTRVWFLARRGEVNEDPLIFISHDRPSIIMAVVAVILLWLSN